MFKHTTLFAAVAGLVLAMAATSAGAGIIGQLGVLDDTANGGINPATSAAWAPGDTYHLAFVTSGTRDATDPDIATYHAFVQAAATAASMGGATWYCIGQSWNDPTRNTNAPPMTTTVGIFLADGVTKLADTGADLANGPDVTFNITEIGTTYNGSIATGSNRKFGDPTPGQTKIETGRSDMADSRWWQQYNGQQASQWHFYAISEELTVVPEPASLALLGLGGLGLILGRKRR